MRCLAPRYSKERLASPAAADELWPMLRQTPFHSRTAPLVRANTWRRWSGFAVASSYEPTHEREYAAIRNAAALIDVSPLFKYRIRGRDAARLLDRTVTRNVRSMREGRVVYTTWCDSHGKIIDDGTLARLRENDFRLTSADPSLRWLTLNAAGMDVQIDDVSNSTAALAIQGPLAREILAPLSDDTIPSLPYFGTMTTSLAGIPVDIARTGYTGDLGYEIFASAQDAVTLWDLLMSHGERHGITPAGIWALDTARIEAGLVMAGVDYHSAHHAMIAAQLSSPFELGLGWTVSSGKGPYNGRTALEIEKNAPASWRLVGLEVDWESLELLYTRHHLSPSLPAVAWRSSAPLFYEGVQVGYASSGCWSPLLKKYIALAHVRSPHHGVGERLGFELMVEHEHVMAAATVVALPFLDLPRKRE